MSGTRSKGDGKADDGVIVHYHIYKNAGSSVDRLLAESFGTRWAPFDPTPGTKPARMADLAAFCTANPTLRAVSSHSTSLAWPGLHNVRACPIVLLRHPLDRVRSVYEFALKDASQPDHEMALKGSLRGYVEERLSIDGHRSGIGNYQVSHLSEASVRAPMPWFADPVPADLEFAKALVASLPAFGLVRRFAQSMQAFEHAYAPRVPGLRLYEVRENAGTSDAIGEAEAIAAVEAQLGPETSARLIEANRLDLELYAFATSLFEARNPVMAAAA